MRGFCIEFLMFGLKQARACVFAGSFLSLLLLSKYVAPPGLTRYDFLFLSAVVLQILLLVLRLETPEECLVLAVFHALGLTLELFKTSPAIGSWSYPEAGFFKLGTVPLYSGFMYAAVASYMCQAWRLLRLDLSGYPPYRFSAPLAAGIYLNFFTHHFVPDIRWLLVVAVFVVFWRTSVSFTPAEKARSMPLVLSFALIGFFVWIAENFSTYFGAWVYPEQRHAWRVVSFRILSSWVLLVIVSFILVADLKHVHETLGRRPLGQRLRRAVRVFRRSLASFR
jgi:uncharacterized membrane protein YoaT (DUF817 family)